MKEQWTRISKSEMSREYFYNINDMNTKENKIDALIAKMDKLTEKEKGGLLGGVSSFQLIMRISS